MRINKSMRDLDNWRAAKQVAARMFWFNFHNTLKVTLRTLALGTLILLVLTVAAHAGTTASWYGTTDDHTDPFDHTTTANGEHFNENALTAASWKYKLGSRVKVTNTRNGKSVIVRINDRGPSKRLMRKGRVIDLTRGSFAKIAQLRDGVIPVQIVLISGGSAL